MPIITSIKAQKKQKRVNIYLDNKYSFSLDLENLLKFNLKINQEITSEDIKTITDESEKAKALEKVISFASLRPRSKKEIMDYFKRKNTNPPASARLKALRAGELIQQFVIEKLEKYGLLDDTKFAKWWVEQRLQFKNKSKKDITFELRQKGIDNQTIKNVLDDSEIDEIKIAKNLIFKKFYKWQKYDEKVRRQKISQYLAGKGFNWDVIQKVANSF